MRHLGLEALLPTACLWALFTAAFLPFPAGAQARRLTVEEARSLAIGNADSLKAKRFLAEGSARAAEEAVSAFFPRINAQGAAAWLVNPPQGLTVPRGELGTIAIPNVGVISLPSQDLEVLPDTKNAYVKITVSFTQPLFAWGKIKAAADLAGLEAELSSRAAALEEGDVVRDVDRAYFGALVSGRSAGILEELVGLASGIADDRRAALSQGQVTEVEVLDAEAGLAQLRAKRAEAVESEATALESLEVLTGMEMENVELTSTLPDALPSFDEEALKQKALDASEELSRLASRLEEAKRKLDLERGASILLPDLSLQVSGDVIYGQGAKGVIGGLGHDWSWDLTIGVGTTVKLFDAGASAARVAAAEKDHSAASAALAGEVKLVRLEVRRAVETARAAASDLFAKDAKARWAALARKNAEIAAANDMLTRGELSAARITDATARLDLLSARYALQRAVSDLERLAGGTL
jgi:outer membrane protein